MSCVLTCHDCSCLLACHACVGLLVVLVLSLVACLILELACLCHAGPFGLRVMLVLSWLACLMLLLACRACVLLLVFAGLLVMFVTCWLACHAFVSCCLLACLSCLCLLTCHGCVCPLCIWLVMLVLARHALFSWHACVCVTRCVSSSCFVGRVCLCLLVMNVFVHHVLCLGLS